MLKATEVKYNNHLCNFDSGRPSFKAGLNMRIESNHCFLTSNVSKKTVSRTGPKTDV